MPVQHRHAAAIPCHVLGFRCARRRGWSATSGHFSVTVGSLNDVSFVKCLGASSGFAGTHLRIDKTRL